ncbi:MAG: sirohydrochlorin chelatase [Cytophagales bacterium]|nr:sirohydrochlorin chelatase [Cytophagales bacterium]
MKTQQGNRQAAKGFSHPKEAILLCGHGTRKKEGLEEFQQLAEKMKLRYEDRYVVDYGFLEFNQPTYSVAVAKLYKQGIRKIYALPIILFAGSHAKNDIPYEMNTLQAEYEDLEIRMGRPLGLSSFLLELAAQRIREVQTSVEEVPYQETCLIVVGRGTTDPDANSDVQKMMRMLWEGMGFGFGVVAYSGTTPPSVAQTIDLLSGLSFRRFVLIPFFFFTGILLDRIYAEAHKVLSFPRILCADAFGDDELVLKAFDERLEETREGNGNMNCQLCKYRKQIIGFEHEQGKEQVGHHLHVRGIVHEPQKPSTT